MSKSEQIAQAMRTVIGLIEADLAGNWDTNANRIHGMGAWIADEQAKIRRPVKKHAALREEYGQAIIAYAIKGIEE